MNSILAFRMLKSTRSCSLSALIGNSSWLRSSAAVGVDAQRHRFLEIDSTQSTAPSPFTNANQSKFSERTHTCNELTEQHVGHRVTLCGWLQFKRMNFALLRDGFGVTQVVLTNELNQLVENTQTESVLRVQGTVVRRPEGQARVDMLSGQVEIVADDIEVLSRCRSDLAFRPREYQKKTEALRLKYRYLDLRHKEMQRNLRLRSKLTNAFRSRLIEEYGFCEVETPTLFRRTPGGAREFPVACHSHPHEFYSLTQSPQQFKQLLMVGSMDRYFQIARCYRDEGARPDRQPEFTQVDIEMSFVTLDNLMKLLEDLIRSVWPVSVAPFRVMSYKEAMTRFGSDKPDLRYDLSIEDGQQLVPSIPISLPTGHCVKALRLPNGFNVVKPKNIREWQIAAKQFGLNELFEVVVREDGTIKSPVANLLHKDSLQKGSVTILAWGPEHCVLKTLGKVRTEFAQIAGLLQGKESDFEFVWITDFPLFSKDSEQRLVSEHHPFTAPRKEHVELLDTDPLSVIGQHFDLVLNGWEVGGGSIRIHSSTLQRKILDNLLQENCSELEHLLEALDSGAPPHGGFAFGLDRLLSILCGTASIRDVIAFPKSHEGRDLMAASPTALSDEDLEFFHLQGLKSNLKRSAAVQPNFNEI